MSASFADFTKDMNGKRCAVIGMGVSNIPLIRLLLCSGAEVLVCDKKEEHDTAIVEEFRTQGAKFLFGERYLSSLGDSDVIFKTPGMRYDVPELLEAKARGCVITTEMEQFLSLCPCVSIGITGSDGKTTTTTIVGELLRQAGKRTFVGGNIGTPLLADTDKMTGDDFAVVELSSFQLMNIGHGTDISVITNITPNHLDMHKSMEEYTEAKKQIYKTASGKVVLNFDNDITRAIAEELGGRAVLFSSKELLDSGYCVEDGFIVFRKAGESEKILALSDIKIQGMHNVENYMAAIAATRDFVSLDDIRTVAREFGGVEHRMELVRELSGVKYYNDSIASSPTRTIAGLRAFDKKVILIAGGYDKKIPFDELGPAVLRYVKTLVLVGDTSEKIRLAVENTSGYDPEKLPIIMCASFEDAVRAASENAASGDIVTLSPACASFDMFKNFMLRGERFKELVNAL